MSNRTEAASNSTAAPLLNGAPARLPQSAHTTQPWRIHELTGDFHLEDVWALPGASDPDGFPHLVLAAIQPFRHLLIDPPMLKEIGRRWSAATSATPHGGRS